MIGPNLSEWAINKRSLIIYFMIMALVAGTFAFFKLGRNEDPAFTFRTAIVSAVWPGATIEETLLQVTERLERTLQETPNLDRLRSYTVPGQTTIFVDLKGATPAAIVLPGGKAGLGKEPLHALVHHFSVHSRPHGLQRERLPPAHGLPEVPLRLRRPAAHHRAGHVAIIPRARIAREDVQDDQLAGPQRPGAAMMRIARLLAARHDRPGRSTAGVQDGGFNFGPQPLRRERRPAPGERIRRGDLCRTQHLHPARHPGLRDREGTLQQLEFAGGFLLALREEEAFGRAQPHPAFLDQPCQPERETGGHFRLPHLAREEEGSHETIK